MTNLFPSYRQCFPINRSLFCITSPIMFECGDPRFSLPHLFLFRVSKCSTETEEFPFMKTLWRSKDASTFYMVSNDATDGWPWGGPNPNRICIICMFMMAIFNQIATWWCTNAYIFFNSHLVNLLTSVATSPKMPFRSSQRMTFINDGSKYNSGYQWTFGNVSDHSHSLC